MCRLQLFAGIRVKQLFLPSLLSLIFIFFLPFGIFSSFCISSSFFPRLFLRFLAIYQSLHPILPSPFHSYSQLDRMIWGLCCWQHPSRLHNSTSSLPWITAGLASAMINILTTTQKHECLGSHYIHIFNFSHWSFQPHANKTLHPNVIYSPSCVEDEEACDIYLSLFTSLNDTGMQIQNLTSRNFSRRLSAPLLHFTLFVTMF